MNQNGTPETYPLDEETIELVQEYQKQILLVEHRMGGALDAFLRHHKLQGNWMLAQNMKEVVKRETAGAMPVFDDPSQSSNK
jgi:hypothetical protein